VADEVGGVALGSDHTPRQLRDPGRADVGDPELRPLVAESPIRAPPRHDRAIRGRGVAASPTRRCPFVMPGTVTAGRGPPGAPRPSRVASPHGRPRAPYLSTGAPRAPACLRLERRR